MEWMVLPLKRYFEFRGRSRRKEFWMFYLFVIVVSVILSLVDAMLGLGGSASSFADRSATGVAAGARTSGGILSSIFSIAIFIPSLAVSVRRLHDRDRSGWWLAGPYALFAVGAALAFSAIVNGAGPGLLGGLLFVVGGIGFVVLLVWFCMDGTRGPNRFGPDPKGGFGDLEETFR